MTEKKINLLVADDHLLFVEGLKHILRDELDVVISGVAVNGKEAIQKCKKEHFDIILMDINMPVIDGIEATREIKIHCPETKVIMVSMIENPSSVTKALKAGADGYVLKNSGTQDLMDAFRTVLKDKTYITPSIAHFFEKEGTSKKTSKSDYIKFSESIITPREHQILKLIVEGFTDQEIANTLFLSDKTVSTHRKNIQAKLKVKNTASLVKFAIENKLV